MPGESKALALADRERVERLAQAKIVEADVEQPLEAFLERSLGAEEAKRLAHREREHLGDAEAAHLDLQDLLAIAGAEALGARGADIGEELHIHGLLPLSLARLATTTGLVEAERTRVEVADARIGRLREQL